jgi:uncharacterized SAM-binding protein YcdF (DUF218 family)
MHMPRAAGAFRKADFEVIAVPADFRTDWRDPDTLLQWLPNADNLCNSGRALHEWLGIAAYRMRGWM